MSRANIVIIEDEFFAANHLAELVGKEGFAVQDIYHSGEDFLQNTDWRFDAAIVDIFLAEEMTGLDVAKHLVDHHKPFIFLTANQDTRTLKDAARLSPAAYISKPFKPNDVTAALHIIANSLAPKIKVRGLHGVEEISPSDIMFIHSDGAYIEIQTTKGSIVQRKLLREIADELPSFVRVHRSYLINEDYIDQRSASSITIRDHTIPISRDFKDSSEE
ncbi:MAG: response regulator transcription factor [Flavobacteriales bacterium]